MMVLSDGNPSCPNEVGRNVLYADLKRATKEIEAAGVDLISIGIMTDAPRNFYRQSTIINNVSELPATVMSELKKHLMK